MNKINFKLIYYLLLVMLIISFQAGFMAKIKISVDFVLIYIFLLITKNRMETGLIVAIFSGIVLDYLLSPTLGINLLIKTLQAYLIWLLSFKLLTSNFISYSIILFLATGLECIVSSALSARAFNLQIIFSNLFYWGSYRTLFTIMAGLLIMPAYRLLCEKY